MTILPLIERELRVRARGRALHWTRFAAALLGTLLCLPMTAAGPGLAGSSQAMVGHAVFLGIATAAFILVSCAAFLTVDGISRERREGTLGLLCLTKVRALDVLLGSFGSAGITCVGALLAFLPVIMLPVLAGGVTGGEALRTMLVLVDTLLLSLAAGLWASAGARGWFESARQAAVILLLVFLASVLPGSGADLQLLSPVTALRMAQDADYLRSGPRYWNSLALVHGLSWLFLLGAGFRLHHAMREGTGKVTERNGAQRRKAGKRRPLKETDDPIRWLVRRQRGIRVLVWAGALVGFIYYLTFSVLVRWLGPAFIASANWIVNIAISAVEGVLFAWAASRFLAEGRRTGELELLLTSPVGVKAIVAGQWTELKRIFLPPVVVMAAPGLINTISFMFMAQNFSPSFNRSNYYSYLAVATMWGLVNTFLGIGALIWAALWLGFRALARASAILWTVLFTRILASLVYYFWNNFVQAFSYFGSIGSSYRYWLWLVPQFAMSFYFVWLMRFARRRLEAELENPSTAPFGLERSFSEIGVGLRSLIAKVRQWPPTPER